MTLMKLGRCALLIAALAATITAVVGVPKPRHAHRGPFAAGQPYVTLGPLVTAHAQINPPTCISSSGITFRCYSPALLQQAYDWPNGLTGRGQTIVIVDAFGDSTISSDLDTFDAQFGVPPASLEIVGPNGVGDQTDPNVQAWRNETALDVEYAHAMAPAAKIVLVVASDDSDDTMNAAEAAALPNYPRAIVSHSFGSPETDDIKGDVVLHHVFVAAQRLGDTLVAGAGDFGATDGLTHPSAAYPSSDPLVVSVGGTEGQPYPDGLLKRNGYGKEQVWNEGDTFDLATGGAPSVLFPAPVWQIEFSRWFTRTTPDVAFDAAVNGGVVIVVGGNVTLIGGTSVGSPNWAALFALVNEARAASGKQPIGLASPSLYAVARDGKSYRQDYHDIKVGNNALDSPIGFQAKPGYDLATGLGTPDATNLVTDLVGGGGGPGSDSGDPSGKDEGGGGRHHDRSPGR